MLIARTSNCRRTSNSRKYMTHIWMRSYGSILLSFNAWNVERLGGITTASEPPPWPHLIKQLLLRSLILCLTFTNQMVRIPLAQLCSREKGGMFRKILPSLSVYVTLQYFRSLCVVLDRLTEWDLCLAVWQKHSTITVLGQQSPNAQRTEMLLKQQTGSNK